MTKPHEKQQGWPARLVIAGIVTSAMVLTAVLLIGISWFGWQQTPLIDPSQIDNVDVEALARIADDSVPDNT